MGKGIRARLRTGVVIAGLTVVTGIAIGGCGGSSEEADTGDGVTNVRVAVIPIAPVAPLYLGIEQGFFEDERLAVEPVVVNAGSPAVPAVLKGDYEFAFANTISLLAAAERGLPVTIVSQGVLGEDRAQEAWSKVLVREDSSIRTVEDLAGKTIAVNAVQNIGDLTIMRAAEKAGVDPSTLSFIEIPFPDMNAALDAGRVDAIWAVEPFVTIGEASGQRPVVAPYSATVSDLTIATYFTSTDFAEESPEVVDRFVRAINRSLEYADAHPDAARATVAKSLGVPAEVAAEMELPSWSADLSLPTIELTGELGARYGALQREPELDALIRQPADDGA